MSQYKTCMTRSPAVVPDIVRRLSSAVLGVAVLSLLAVSVEAADAPASHGYEIVHKRVDYSDLDVSRHAGVNTLYVRLRRAAASVCEDPGMKGLRELRWHQKCADEALASAVRRVSHAALTELYVANNKPKSISQPAQSVPQH